MNILVINCGSSSLKYQLIDSDSEKVLAKGLCERIGSEGSCITHTPQGGTKRTEEIPMPDHNEAIKAVIGHLLDPNVGVISSLSEIGAVGHRIVHGGEKFNKAVLIDDEVVRAIGDVSDLAPLHNPANLIGIHACQRLMPGVPMVAVFDTAFHQTMPPEAYLYAIPLEYYKDYKVRRYGFHGTSHDYVSQRAAEILGKKREDLRIIVCHLGNGASICAVENGKSIDTSMGLTPLAGLVMGTRSGDIDPAIVEYYGKEEGLTVSETITALNKQSGIYGLTGGTSDFRDLEEGYMEGKQDFIDAMELFCYDVAKYIGAYTAALNGVDDIVFTAGIGEHSPFVREKVCSYLGYLGVSLDKEANENAKDNTIISTPDSKVTICVIPTNEELMIARDTKELTEGR